MNITIPDEALEAVAKEIASKIYNANWNILTAQMRQECYVFARAACLAMLRNWPGMRNTQNEGGDPNWQHHIILPLHPEKERSDD